jgi:hypothetical protein
LERENTVVKRRGIPFSIGGIAVSKGGDTLGKRWGILLSKGVDTVIKRGVALSKGGDTVI